MRHVILSMAVPLTLLGLAPARAQTSAGAPADPLAVQVRYAGTALGLPVMRAEANLALVPGGYRADLSFHTTGLLSLFASSLIHSTVEGEWAGGLPQPSRFRSWGTLRGDSRQTQIDYASGRPEIRELEPPNETERDDVPEAARQGTMDMLSAATALVAQVEKTGRCDGDVAVFDGRRLTEISATTVGTVHPKPDSTGPWKGDALLCHFIGTQLAGFRHDDPDWARQPHLGTAWIARPIPGAPPIPVRLKFETRWVGSITLVLQDVTPRPTGL